MDISDDLRKLMMAGLGAVNLAAEKTQETVDVLAKRGEEALAQGKVLNERLRHEIQEAVSGNEDKSEAKKPSLDTVLDGLAHLTPDERAKVQQKLNQLGNEQQPDE